MRQHHREICRRSTERRPAPALTSRPLARYQPNSVTGLELEDVGFVLEKITVMNRPGATSAEGAWNVAPGMWPETRRSETLAIWRRA